MCGIFGYRGVRRDAARVVLHGLRELEYRGYDSWGIAVSEGDRALLERRVGKIGEAVTGLPESPVGLGHTRWATHGGVTEGNAHPHLDCTGRVAVVHNGIVANDADIRAMLARAGHVLRSQTDTELIAHLVEEALAEAAPDGSPPGAPPPDAALVFALMRAFRKVQGCNAVAVLDVRTGAIAAVKSGTPLVAGHAGDAAWLASDAAALLGHIREAVFLDDGKAVLLARDRVRVFDVASGREERPRFEALDEREAGPDRGEHPDHMTREMGEQPAHWRRLAEEGTGAIRALAGAVTESSRVFAIGCGSAWHAADLAAHLFAARGRPVTAAAASEFSHLLPLVGPGALVIALSQSGETADVLESVRAARARGVRVAAVTNAAGSSLGRFADLLVPLGAGPERCVLATKSFTAKIAHLLLLVASVCGGSRERTEAADSLLRAADEVEAVLAGARRAALLDLARAIHRRDHLFVLGRGRSRPLALEAALKIKEASYVHAEGFAAGELKHGVIALVEPGTPCVALAPADATQADLLASASQVRARGASVIGVAARPHDAFDHHIPVADVGDATVLAQAVVGQLLGYDLARLRGHDPDKPRNLAKSVTVK